MVDTGAAFVVTSQNTATTAAAGSGLTVNWNVAGTTAAPISAPTVDILLSTDGGVTFPTALASGTANDGSETVLLPTVDTATARIMVIRSGSNPGVKFFSINQADITIGDGGCTDNDDFVCADSLIPGTPANGTNVGFGVETNEPSRSCGGSTIATAWYTWTAPANAQTTVTLDPGSYDTAMAVYTGSTVDGLAEVECNDDIGNGVLLSEVTFDAVTGTTYRIQVGGFNGDTGTFTLTLTTTGAADLTVLPFACPVFDSRTADAAVATSPLDGGDTAELQITGVLPAGQGVGTASCVPQGATAAVLTVVAIDPQAVGNLRLSPSGGATGGVVNYASNGLDNTNTITVPVGDDGQVTLAVNGGAAGQGLPSTDVRLVVQGYYAPGSGWRYNPVVPCAAADSRATQGATGLFAGPWSGGAGSPSIDVTGTIPTVQGGGGADCGVPDTAEGVVVNIVAVRAEGGTGHLAVGPGGTFPTEYVTGFPPLGRNNAAVAYVPLAPDGTINVDIIANTGTPTTHVRVVVLGYLDDTTGLTFQPVVACSASIPGQARTPREPSPAPEPRRRPRPTS